MATPAESDTGTVATLWDVRMVAIRALYLAADHCPEGDGPEFWAYQTEVMEPLRQALRVASDAYRAARTN